MAISSLLFFFLGKQLWSWWILLQLNIWGILRSSELLPDSVRKFSFNPPCLVQQRAARTFPAVSAGWLYLGEGGSVGDESLHHFWDFSWAQIYTVSVLIYSLWVAGAREASLRPLGAFSPCNQLAPVLAQDLVGLTLASTPPPWAHSCVLDLALIHVMLLDCLSGSFSRTLGCIRVTSSPLLLCSSCQLYPRCAPIGYLPMTFVALLIPSRGCFRWILPDQWFCILFNHPYGLWANSLGFISSIKIWNFCYVVMLIKWSLYITIISIKAEAFVYIAY